MKRKRLFFVDVLGAQRKAYTGTVVIISEKKLPPPSKRFKWQCACYTNPMPRRIPIDTVMDIVIGDPIVLRKCIFGGRVRKSKKDAPEEVRRLAQDNPTQRLFEFVWKKRRVWILGNWVSRLEDMIASLHISVI